MSEDSCKDVLSQLTFSLEDLARMESLLSLHEKGNPDSLTTSSAEKTESENKLPDTVTLNSMFSDMTSTEVTFAKAWSALQHYVYFLYRHAVSIKPYNNGDTMPLVICRAIAEIFDNLMERDMTQVCLKLVSIVRDYALVAKGHMDNIESTDTATYLVTLMAYYSALCSSAGKCAPLFPEFDFLTLRRYNLNWIGVNKSIFYLHIYLSSSVQAKIPLFKKLQEENNPKLKGLLETFVCFTQDMQALATKWVNLIEEISSASKSRAEKNPKKYLVKDWKMYSEHKRIFTSHLWVNRTSKEIKMQDMDQLDAHILAWVADKTCISESLIDDRGCCLCEDCLAAEFRNNSMANALAQSYRAETSADCLILCYICRESIILDALVKHMVEQHFKAYANAEQLFSPLFHTRGKTLDKELKTRTSHIYEGLLEKNARIKRSLLELIEGSASDRNKKHRAKNKKTSSIPSEKENVQQPSNKHSDAFSASKSGDTLFPFKPFDHSIFDSDDNPFKDTKDVFLKLAADSSLLQNGDDSLFMEATNSEECKMFFEQMKKLVESNNAENNRVTNKQKRESLGKYTQTANTKKDAPKTASSTQTAKKTNISPLDEEALIASALENGTVQKPHLKGGGGNIDSRVIELIKTVNANVHKAASISPPKTSDVCLGHSCGHRCKEEEELRRINCIDACGHHKDSRKCDCAYCEVFGSGFPPNCPRPSETRDRLRSRLNQRKEKRKENMDSGTSRTATHNSKSTIRNSGNCTNKMSRNSKMSISNSKFTNTTSKITKAFQSDIPRVPELNHPVPPPGSTNTNLKATVVPPDSATLDFMGDDCSGHRSSSSLSTCSLFSDPVDCRDINELLNYIEGNKTVDKVAIAHKKAAKKARQRSKKAQEKEERERIELEKQKQKEAKLREEKLKEEERIKAEASAKLLADEQKRIKRDEQNLSKQELKKNTKKNSKQENAVKITTTTKVVRKSSKLVEENIPAMVTIKRASEGSNSQATVTITLKGSTPDTDKLLLSFVNGNENAIKENTVVPVKAKVKATVSNKPAQPTITKVVTENVKPQKIKKVKENIAVAKPMKDTIAVDKNGNKKEAPVKKFPKMETFASHQLQQAFNNNYKEPEVTTVKPQGTPKEEVPLPMLNLPPGITITKIDGPSNTAICKYPNPNSANSNNHNHIQNQNHNTNIPSTKSGVIVVDTEKLIQQSIAASISKRDKKLNKKKRDPNASLTQPPTPAVPLPAPPPPPPPPSPPKASEHKKVVKKASESATMVTLKNPIFDAPKSNALSEKTNFDFNPQHASIVKGENGMVTIRSPRMQNPFENGTSASSYFSDTQPAPSTNISSPYSPISQPSNFYQNTSTSLFQNSNNSHYQNTNNSLYQNNNASLYQNINNSPYQNTNSLYLSANNPHYQNTSNSTFQNTNNSPFQNANNSVYQNTNNSPYQNMHNPSYQTANNSPFQNTNNPPYQNANNFPFQNTNNSSYQNINNSLYQNTGNTPYQNTNNNPQFSPYNSHYHAREFLAGLPGIEITKINKAAAESQNEEKKMVQQADVPSPPTNIIVSDTDTFNFDTEDWYYENVFKPKNDGEDEDMDAEELELEEFKRFCHQPFCDTHVDNTTHLDIDNIGFNPTDVSFT